MGCALLWLLVNSGVHDCGLQISASVGQHVQQWGNHEAGPTSQQGGMLRSSPVQSLAMMVTSRAEMANGRTRLRMTFQR